MVAGVYMILNTATGKGYVGSAVDFRWRRNKHFSELRRGIHHSPKLQRSWDKHGEEAFIFKPLLFCDRSKLLMYEQLAIDGYDTFENGYNALKTAGSRLGMKLSEEARQKLIASKLGKKRPPFSAEWLANMAKSKVGKQKCLGYKHTEEAKANMSKARLAKHIPRSPNWKITDEGRAKISATHKGNKYSVGKNLGNKYRLGKKMSDEAKQKMSLVHKGVPKSPEQRAKMAESARLAWIERRKK